MDLFERFLDGEIAADDPRLASQPPYLRAQVDSLAARVAEHEASIGPMIARREACLREAGSPFEGSVRVTPDAPQPRVLVVTDLGNADDFFFQNLFGLGEAGDDRTKASAAWRGIKYDKLSFGFAEEASLVRRCQQAIVSGDYHAVVICELSLQDMMEAPERLFDRLLGSHLQAFARAGGHVAFPTSDGLLLANDGLLNRLFGTTWRAACYTSEPWGPLPNPSPDALFVAPATTPAIYTKASTLAGVPPHERVCGLVEAGAIIGPDGDFETQAAFDEHRESRGSSDAVHAYGAGLIGYFGDTNCSAHNPPVIAAFCRSAFDKAQQRRY